MRIGLIRHFQVDEKVDDYIITAAQYCEYMDNYNNWDVIPKEVDLKGIDWNKCYSSDMMRAKKTAEYIYKGPIIQSDKIREIAMVFNLERLNERRVHMFEWTLHSMVNWAKCTDVVLETIDDSRARVVDFLDALFLEVEDEDNILIFSHKMIMTILDEELKKRGFQGEDVVAAHNGELFILEK